MSKRNDCLVALNLRGEIFAFHFISTAPAVNERQPWTSFSYGDSPSLLGHDISFDISNVQLTCSHFSSQTQIVPTSPECQHMTIVLQPYSWCWNYRVRHSFLRSSFCAYISDAYSRKNLSTDARCWYVISPNDWTSEWILTISSNSQITNGGSDLSLSLANQLSCVHKCKIILVKEPSLSNNNETQRTECLQTSSISTFECSILTSAQLDELSKTVDKLYHGIDLIIDNGLSPSAQSPHQNAHEFITSTSNKLRATINVRRNILSSPNVQRFILSNFCSAVADVFRAKNEVFLEWSCGQHSVGVKRYAQTVARYTGRNSASGSTSGDKRRKHQRDWISGYAQR